MPRPFWIGTSWKMNKTRAEATAYAEALAASPEIADRRLQPFVVPPFTALADVAAVLANSRVLVGAQNMHWADSGAFTGEISPLMLADCGAGLVELGHSERRRYFNETDEAINRKVLAALAHGLWPLICIGESAAEKSLGVATDTVIRQARIALAGVEPVGLARCLIAYEPVWAIGDAGSPATPGYARAIHAALAEALPRDATGEPPPVLYGGSVNPDNAANLAAIPEIGGLFIGRSAWSVEGYLAVMEHAATGRFERR